MKVSQSDPRWAAVLAPYASALPPASVDKGRVIPALAALTRDGCVASVVRDGAQLAARIGRVVSATKGWPQPRIGKLDELAASASAIVPDSEVAATLAAGVSFGAAKIVGSVLDELDGALSAITGVPILGWIVALGRVVWQVVDAARARAPTIADAMAIGYDRDADSAAAQHVIDLCAEDDWSPIFMPPQGDFRRERLAYTASGYADGDAWGQISGIAFDSIGALPGVAEIAGYWQSPRHLIGSSRLAGRESIQSAATLLPSTTSLCNQIWCAAQAGGLGTTGRIDFRRIEDAWTDYAGALQQFAGATRGGGDPTKPQASPEHGWLADQIIRAFSWSIANQDPLYGIVRSKVPAQYRIGLLDRIVAWRCAQARFATLQAWQRTPSVAYVPENAPALADTTLREAWKRNRRQLLQRASRRRGLDVSLVPPGEYRQQLAALPIPPGVGETTIAVLPLGTFDAGPTGGGGKGKGKSRSSSTGALVAAGVGIGGVAAIAAMVKR